MANKPSGLGFSVDTQLFRELGELLVGRDSTALVELIKNSYDADATKVSVYGERLQDPETGQIRVTDNGSGMTERAFLDGFLRIASRLKVDGNRYSGRLHRRFTGAKGIGRLAAHKLARVIEVESRSWEPDASSIAASIDWDAVERVSTFDEVAETGAIVLQQAPSQVGGTHGTTITLRKLRRKWTSAELARFVGEVQLYSPPPLLVGPIEKHIIRNEPLFEQPSVRDAAQPAAFEVELLGEFEAGDDYWTTLAAAASWLIEIDCQAGKSGTKIRISPIGNASRERPWLEPREVQLPATAAAEGLAFQGRIFVREGAVTGPVAVRTWAASISGIRVYMEGFRVLPYGEPGNDWLEIDSEYARRRRVLSSLRSLEEDETLANTNEGLSRLPAQNYLGGIFLREQNSAGLRMLVNREGFVPDAAFLEITGITRTAIELLTRVRAAATRREAELQSASAVADNKTTTGPMRATARLSSALVSATEAASAARQELTSASTSPSVLESLTTLQQALSDAAEARTQLDEDRKMTLVLASVGLQMSSFNHEVTGLIGMVGAMELGLKSVMANEQLADGTRRGLTMHLRSLEDLRRSLERQASYLVDIVSLDSRRRRSRQQVRSTFESARNLFTGELERRGIRLSSALPEELRSPPMFKAELVAVFTNLLSNAIKAAGTSGAIEVTGKTAGRGGTVLVQNTGVAINLTDADRWFRPFESTTSVVDPALGQGMGLGLPITRALLESYSSSVQFVEPSMGYATAVEVRFPA